MYLNKKHLYEYNLKEFIADKIPVPVKEYCNDDISTE